MQGGWIGRQALHAASLLVEHPTTKEPFQLTGTVRVGRLLDTHIYQVICLTGNVDVGLFVVLLQNTDSLSRCFCCLAWQLLALSFSACIIAFTVSKMFTVIISCYVFAAALPEDMRSALRALNIPCPAQHDLDELLMHATSSDKSPNNQ